MPNDPDTPARLAHELRAGVRLAPPTELPGRNARPSDPGDRAYDRRGREIEPGDPILFAASGPFSGVYFGRYLGRDPVSGRMVARVDIGEPRAGEQAAILTGLTIRARAEDIRAEVCAAVAREIMELDGRATL